MKSREAIDRHLYELIALHFMPNSLASAGAVTVAHRQSDRLLLASHVAPIK